jgi:hypothetical protein
MRHQVLARPFHMQMSRVSFRPCGLAFVQKSIAICLNFILRNICPNAEEILDQVDLK